MGRNRSGTDRSHALRVAHRTPRHVAVRLILPLLVVLTGLGASVPFAPATVFAASPVGSGSFSVDATDNIWGAGLTTPPDPGGGGGGTLPSDISVPAGAGVVTVGNGTGSVTYCSGCNSAIDGAPSSTWCSCVGPVNITAYGGISGIEDSSRGFYMVGVFLDGSQPSTAPATLNFTHDHSFSGLAPELGQVFFIGDGLEGTGSGMPQQFVVPAGATDLYLGFPDAGGFEGAPGYYGDNGGTVTGSYDFWPSNAAQLHQYMAEGNPSVSTPDGCSCQAGDPVSNLSGDLYQSETDVSVPGRGFPLNLTRSYNSLSAATNGPFGYGWSANLGMSLVEDSGAGTVTITDESGAPVVFDQIDGQWVAPSAFASTLTQNSGGSWTYSRWNGESFTFNSSGQLTSETDRNGNTTSLSYASGQLATMTDASGRTLAFSWSGGHITQVTDPASQTVSYSYDGSGNLASVTNIDGKTESFTYDSSHLLLTVTDPNGGTTTNTYDKKDRVLTQTDPMGYETMWSYSPDGSGSSTLVTDPLGRETQYVFDDAGRLLSQTNAFGTSLAATTTYTYDPVSGGVASVTTPGGHTSSHAYDSSGNVLSTTNALGDTWNYTYNGLNEVLTATDPLGVTTTNTYDSAGNLLTTSTPLLNAQGQVLATRTTTYTYGDATNPGLPTAIQDPDGHTTTITYDTYGDVASSTDAAGDETTFTYDILGRTLTEVAPDGNVSGCGCAATYTTTYAYNPYNEVTSVTDPNGHVTSYTYDNDGNQLTVTQPDGTVSVTTYDADNQATEVQTKNSSGTVVRTTSTGYDHDGEVTSQTDGNGNTTTYAYNGLGEQTSSTNALGKTTSYTYTPDGNVLTATEPTGVVVTNTYDAADELTRTAYSDGTPRVILAYDGDGRKTSMKDGTGNSAWTYDSLGRTTSYTNGAGEELQYAYDLAGNETGITYPNGKMVTYGYDATNRMTSVTDWNGKESTFVYDASGNLTTGTLPNGVAESNSYDPAGNVTAISDTTGSTTDFSASYSYDANNRVTSDSSQLRNAVSTAYTGLGQVCNVAASGAAGCPSSIFTSYAYDAAGNVTGMGDYPTQGSFTQSYNGGAELCWRVYGSSTNGCGSVPAQATTFGFDANGNRTSETPAVGQGATYGYNGAGELTSVAASGPAASTPVAGSYEGGAVMADGTVAMWGEDTSGQLGDGETANRPYPVTPGMSKVTQLAEGDGSTVALTGKGTVWAWGDNSYGELGNGTTTSSSTPVEVSGLTNVVSVATNGETAAAVESNGSVWTWGDGYDGILGNNNTSNSDVPVEVCAPGSTTYPCTSFLTGATQVQVGLTFIAVVRSDGTAWSWGWSDSTDSLGNTSTTDSEIPIQMTGLSSVTDISAGPNASGGLALISGGTVWGWGEADSGQMGSTSCTPAPCGVNPTQISSLSSISSVSADASSRMAVTSSGTVQAWGMNNDGQLGLGFTNTSGCECVDSPATVVGSSGTGSLTGVSKVAVGTVSAVAVLTDGTTWAWGQWLGLGNGGATSGLDPSQVPLSGPAASEANTYDGAGLLTSQTLGSATTGFVWDETSGVPGLMEQTAAAGDTFYVYGPTGPLEEILPSGSTYWYAQDRMGSTRALTDSTGTVANTYTYNTYGSLAASTGSVANPLLYDGQYLDANSGLYYMRARWYDPATGQFTSVDSLVAQTGQPYMYAGGDPVNASDPSGAYDYTYSWDLGSAQQLGSPQQVFGYFAGHINRVFPFSTGGCSAVHLGTVCTFHPAGVTNDRLHVTAMSSCSLSLTVLNWPAGDPAGSVITFSTYERDGQIYLSQHGYSPQASWYLNIVAPQIAHYDWSLQAHNLAVYRDPGAIREIEFAPEGPIFA